MDVMEIENAMDSNGNAYRMKENGFDLRPVRPDESGEGLPYAPQDWPNPGDNWIWKVGKRKTITGHYLDRYLYLPSSLRNSEYSSSKKYCFPSKLSLERFIRKEFPETDIDAFFASFSWKIPATSSSSTSGVTSGRMVFPLPSKDRTKNSASDVQLDILCCKAGNRHCRSLLVDRDPASFAVMPCDICCSEPQFCHDCCCILCCKPVDSTCWGYSYIECKAVVAEGYVCGHLAHLDCALQSYMAGTVGGSIGLDAEYFCRRCDARTDLVSHVQRLLQTCESIDSRDRIEEMLGTGICVLRGSQRSIAKGLLRRIELVMAKLKSGTNLEEIWNVEDIFSAMSTGASDLSNDHDKPADAFKTSEWIMSIPFDHETETLKLEDEVDGVLLALRKSQECEYELAKERLCL